MQFGWKTLIPVSLAWILIVSTLRVMSDQGAPQYLIFGFAFAVVLIYLVISNYSDNAKAKLATDYKNFTPENPEVLI